MTKDIVITETEKARLDAGQTITTRSGHMLWRTGWQVPEAELYDMGQTRVVVVPDPDTLDIPLEGLTTGRNPS